MKKLILIPLMLVTVIGLMIKCALPETELHIASGSFMTHVTQVDFVNSDDSGSSNRSIAAAEGVVVKITGPDASKVYNIEGLKEFKITGGSLVLLLDPNVDFLGQESYTVNLTVDIPGYETKTVPVTFTKNVNNGYEEVVMLSTANLPKAAAKAAGSGTISTTGLNADVTVTVDNSANKGVTTKVRIPTGIVMQDVNGATVEGDLQVDVTSFSETGNGTAFFPGGLSHTNILNGKDGKEFPGTFATAGFAKINMTVGGKKVTKFKDGTGTVGLDIYLSEGNFNPNTGKPYKEGEEIHIFSLSDNIGKWTYEKTSVVSKDASGKLFVKHETNHLTWYTIGAVNSYIDKNYGGIGGDFLPILAKGFVSLFYCSTDKLKVEWGNLGVNEEVNCRFTVYTGTKNNRSKSFVYNAKINANTKLTMPKFMVGLVSINVHDLDHDLDLGDHDLDLGVSSTLNSSSTGECKAAETASVISIDTPNPLKEKITMQFKGKCSGGTEVLSPVGTRIFFKPEGAADSAYKSFHYVDVDNKFKTTIITDKVEKNKTYDFKVVTGSKTGIKTIPIKGETNIIEVDIPEDICNTLTK